MTVCISPSACPVRCRSLVAFRCTPAQGHYYTAPTDKNGRTDSSGSSEQSIFCLVASFTSHTWYSLSPVPMYVPRYRHNRSFPVLLSYHSDSSTRPAASWYSLTPAASSSSSSMAAAWPHCRVHLSPNLSFSLSRTLAANRARSAEFAGSNAAVAGNSCSSDTARTPIEDALYVPNQIIISLKQQWENRLRLLRSDTPTRLWGLPLALRWSGQV